MVTVYGANWCEDTQRTRRHLRRLAVRHTYLNVDEDLDALERAMGLNHGKRRTPTVELDGEVLVEPANAVLTNALIRHAEITDEEVREYRQVQNVGDLERIVRITVGLLMLTASRRLPRSARWLAAGVGIAEVLSGVTGWSLLYAATGVSSLDGPADHPREAERRTWLTRVNV
jgi:glutaredoxin